MGYLTTPGNKDGVHQKYLWNDLVADVFGRRLNSTSGKVDYDWDENAIKFQSGGSLSNVIDRVQANYQYGHGLIYGDDAQMRFHLHYEQVSATNANVFSLRYRFQINGSEKTTSWTTITATAPGDCVFTFDGHTTLNNIIAFPVIDCSAATISSTIQIQLARTDSVSGDLLVSFMDAHVPFADLGSRKEYVL